MSKRIKKTNSGTNVKKEQLKNKTLLQLDEYLTRIKKFSVKELIEGWLIDDFYKKDKTEKTTLF